MEYNMLMLITDARYSPECAGMGIPTITVLPVNKTKKVIVK